MNKGTAILSYLRCEKLFSEKDKNRAINAIMRAMVCINISLS